MSHTAQRLKVFAGKHSVELAPGCASTCTSTLGAALSETFPDGEIIVKLDEDVRGRDCYVIISTGTPVNDNLMELLIFIDCLKTRQPGGDGRDPYFGYAQGPGPRDEGRVPITAKLVANPHHHRRGRARAGDRPARGPDPGLLRHPGGPPVRDAGLPRVFRASAKSSGDLVLVSPDVGNVKVAESFANILGATWRSSKAPPLGQRGQRPARSSATSGTARCSCSTT